MWYNENLCLVKKRKWKRDGAIHCLVYSKKWNDRRNFFFPSIVWYVLKIERMKKIVQSITHCNPFNLEKKEN